MKDGQQFQPVLAYNVWLSLSVEKRKQLVTLFGIPRTGSNVVEYRASGNVMTSDGHTSSDLRAITTERMQHLLNSESRDFYGLFEEIVDSLDILMQEHTNESVEPEVVAETPKDVLLTWPQFVKTNKGDGRSLQDLADMWKTYKTEHGN